MNLIGLLVALFVICLVIWAARSIMRAFGIGDPIATVVQVVIVLLAMLWLLQVLGFGGLGSVKVGAAGLPAGRADTQIVVPTDSLVWTLLDDVPLATVQGWAFTLAVDAAPPVPVVATCSGTGHPYLCSARLPPMAPGRHDVTLTARSADGEEGVSSPLGYTAVAPVVVPIPLVNINTASASELANVPYLRLGNTWAATIIKGRPYKSVDDLRKAGMTTAFLNLFRAGVTVVP